MHLEVCLSKATHKTPTHFGSENIAEWVILASCALLESCRCRFSVCECTDSNKLEVWILFRMLAWGTDRGSIFVQTFPILNAPAPHMSIPSQAGEISSYNLQIRWCLVTPLTPSLPFANRRICLSAGTRIDRSIRSYLHSLKFVHCSWRFKLTEDVSLSWLSAIWHWNLHHMVRQLHWLPGPRIAFDPQVPAREKRDGCLQCTDYEILSVVRRRKSMHWVTQKKQSTAKDHISW